MITIVNYGLGNLGSIQNMLRKIGSPSIITSDYKEIEQATKLILPGVGAFDSGMHKLKELELIELLNKKVLVEKTPILGVCLGVQLMTNSSQEGILPGLGWFDAETVRFDFRGISGKYSLPNMGWQDVYLQKDSALYENMPTDSRFYFVHNFHLKANNEKDISLTANYGYEYVVGLDHENILGVQFHPEKSHKFGMRLYQNFVNNY
jgi:glutamine amidotransferase